MSARKENTKGKANSHRAQNKNDDDIMNTNDSSIVSKRCVSKLYFPDEPDFYEPFVGKYVRRNPLINRGYWLRMHVIEQVIRQFLEEDNGKRKIVINLGCGYDPLPFQFWHRHAAVSQNCTFVDVDYPQLIERKRDRIMTSDLLRNALLKTNLRPSEGNAYLRSDKYIALGCNLSFPEVLEADLRAELDLSSCSVLFVAEVSVTYMPLACSAALIKWANTLDDARFCLLEQYLPQGPNHPFAKTMLAHFNKIQTPIQAVDKHPSLDQQAARFLNADWPTLSICRSLWDLWSDDAFTPSQLRRGLDAVEPFDEWEEFALFAGHYFLLVASNVKPGVPVQSNIPDKPKANVRDITTCSVIASHVNSEDSPPTPRRFGAACPVANNAVAFHGGQGKEHRLASMDILGRGEYVSNAQPCSMPHARVCHTITSFAQDEALLVGGRTSPSQALADCWRMNGGEWHRAQDLVPARFRHSSTKIRIPYKESGIDAVLVFGGKRSDGIILGDWCIWIPDKGWQNIPVVGSRPTARFGAAISSMVFAQDRGLIVGGADLNGAVLDDVWLFHIDAAPHLQLTFTDLTDEIQRLIPHCGYSRFGASLLPFGQSLILIGGISKKEILSSSNDFLIISCGASLEVTKAELHIPESAYPLLVGFSAAPISSDEFIISGGGAVCFSMGSFWNEGFLSISTVHKSKIDMPVSVPWSIAVILRTEIDVKTQPPEQPASAKGKGKGKGKSKSKSKGKGKGKTRTETRALHHPTVTAIPRLKIQSSEDFTQLLAASKPVILEELDIGPCTELWSLDYLKEKIGPDRELVVHECGSDRMMFKDKNFQYVKKSVGNFFAGIESGEKTYLRAVSASQPNKLPTKLEDDFPTIAADFILPDIMNIVRENYHSSPLRISGPVSLWLHYDVLANVLCQVKGTKTLQLYPPIDAKYLDFPPGGSSSNVDVLASKDARLRHTHPHIAALSPGDVLFIPPMWAHTATPSEGTSVAVNVFFKNLGLGYAAGKDVYGNRDLQAYENGRRDVERISKAFKSLPSDISKFYLDRLVAELQEKADRFGTS
ncbi:LCM-domain-containing protein [Pleomassaria siparia CBS 279.74]|uniref:tRNA wybutosine-synthesizing protein 4 n=1 Tax=Pleomassaria siparia CBS 279.74 TaxID=1314801 RepID=A0A6G1K7Q1_9PLEO|nr:LCM-domain-containing protein [Pleomassaria siparia CBS 279.74]